MKHTHVIEAASADEFKKHVHDLYHSIHSGDRHATTDDSQPALQEKAQAEDKGKKAKKAIAAAAPVVNAAVTTTAAPAASADAVSSDDIFGDEEQPKAPVVVPYTMDDCQKRLQKVVAKHDIKKAKELLSKFGVAKLVELQSDHFVKFITACDDLT